MCDLKNGTLSGEQRPVFKGQEKGIVQERNLIKKCLLQKMPESSESSDAREGLQLGANPLDAARI